MRLDFSFPPDLQRETMVSLGWWGKPSRWPLLEERGAGGRQDRRLVGRGGSVLVTVGVELEAALSFSFHPGLQQAGRQEEEEEIPHLAPRKLPLQVKPGFLCVSSSAS